MVKPGYRTTLKWDSCLHTKPWDDQPYYLMAQWLFHIQKVSIEKILHARIRTHPEVVHSLADPAVLLRDILLKVLIEAGIHREKLGKRWPVVLFSWQTGKFTAGLTLWTASQFLSVFVCSTWVNMQFLKQLQQLTTTQRSASGPVLQLLLLPLQLGCFPLQLLLLFDQVSLASSCSCLVGDGRLALLTLCSILSLHHYLEALWWEIHKLHFRQQYLHLIPNSDVSDIRSWDQILSRFLDRNYWLTTKHCTAFFIFKTDVFYIFFYFIFFLFYIYDAWLLQYLFFSFSLSIFIVTVMLQNNKTNSSYVKTC